MRAVTGATGAAGAGVDAADAFPALLRARRAGLAARSGAPAGFAVSGKEEDVSAASGAAAGSACGMGSMSAALRLRVAVLRGAGAAGEGAESVSAAEAVACRGTSAGSASASESLRGWKYWESSRLAGFLGGGGRGMGTGDEVYGNTPTTPRHGQRARRTCVSVACQYTTCGGGSVTAASSSL